MEDLKTTYSLTLRYYQVTDIWKLLCEKHNELLDLTCQEYSFLLDNKVDELEGKIKEKESLIKEIALIDIDRKGLISELNNEYKIKLNSVSELITFFSDFEQKNQHKHLYRYNALLISIIEKIQSQNKKNQFFLNKALLSLKDLRDAIGGKKTYNTYGSNGSAKTSKGIEARG